MGATSNHKQKAGRGIATGTGRRKTMDAGEDDIAAVVLAAGASRRMGTRNKLLGWVDGRPMVRLVVESALASRAHPVIVVTGYDADSVRQALDGLDVSMEENPRFESGISASVRAGVGAVPVHCAGALVLLADMPRISPTTIDRLIAMFRAHGAGSICVPYCAGRRGNPILWPRDLFRELMNLRGDIGARCLLERHHDRILKVDLDSESIFLDVDTPDDLKML